MDIQQKIIAYLDTRVDATLKEIALAVEESQLTVSSCIRSLLKKDKIRSSSDEVGVVRYELPPKQGMYEAEQAPATMSDQYAIGFAHGYAEASKLLMREAYDAGREDAMKKLLNIIN